MNELLNFLKRYKTSIILAVFGVIDIINGFSQDIILNFNFSEKGALIFKIVMTIILYYRFKVETLKSKSSQLPTSEEGGLEGKG